VEIDATDSGESTILLERCDRPRAVTLRVIKRSPDDLKRANMVLLPHQNEATILSSVARLREDEARLD
jgi:hypothetical protein